MEDEKAGDPTGVGLSWLRRTPDKIAAELSALDIEVTGKTVGKILKQMKFSLRSNSKKVSNGGKKLTPLQLAERDEQFQYIKRQRREFEKNGDPIISIDTKSKELIGNFKNPGTRYKKEADLTNDHDFVHYGVGRAIPSGIYDRARNEGFVYVGQSLWDKKRNGFDSTETAEFVAENIYKWWMTYGQRRYPKARKLLILADSGGANGYRNRMWKYKLHELLCNRCNLELVIAHYPSGASKWNPIEHRLFCEISKNWRGVPLKTFETVLNYIKTTKTKTGLTVKSQLVIKKYKKGMKVLKEDFAKINIKQKRVLPKWNYSLHKGEKSCQIFSS